MEVSAKNAWGKKNCLTPAFLAHTGFFFKISNYQCPLFVCEYNKKKRKKGGDTFFLFSSTQPPPPLLSDFALQYRKLAKNAHHALDSFWEFIFDDVVLPNIPFLLGQW